MDNWCLLLLSGVGLVLGGGYSWVTNQYGLGIDNFVALDLVLPNGTFVVVTEGSQPELFFGLKGGLNNFGIVTGLTLKAYPLGVIYVWWIVPMLFHWLTELFQGGVINYSADQSYAIEQALADFSANNMDVKAQLAAAYVRGDGLVRFLLCLLYFSFIHFQDSLANHFLLLWWRRT